jgi:TRAP transporter TAXI family solute receptor
MLVDWEGFMIQSKKIKQRIPRWLRIALVMVFFVASGVAGYFVYQYTTKPKTLTIAVGSVDGDAVRLLTALGTRMTATNAPVRLNVVDAGTPLGAADRFAKGQADLAIVRADLGDLGNARTVVTIAEATVLIVAPAGAGVSDMDSLRHKTIGVVGYEPNRKVIEALTREYDLATHKTVFVPLLPTQVADALKHKKVQAVMAVVPLTERYISYIRSLAQAMPKGRMVLVPIESAGAIAGIDKAYDSFDVPKGSLRGSPPLPDDDMTTLQVPYYLVANSKLDDTIVNDLAKTIMLARQSLVQQNPLLGQIAAPSTDKDAFIPIHPGAQAYFDGDETTLLDKYGDFIWYGSMALGALTSLFAAIFGFIRKDVEDPDGPPLQRIYTLMDKVDEADIDQLLAIEKGVNRILRDELDKLAEGASEESSVNAVTAAVRRLEYLVGQRRAELREKPSAAPAQSSSEAA